MNRNINGWISEEEFVKYIEGDIEKSVLILDFVKYRKAILQTKYCRVKPSYFKRWYITKEEIITKSRASFPK